MKHIISFFARKTSESQEDVGLSFVRLQAHEGALSGPLPLAVNYLARTRMKFQDLEKSHVQTTVAPIALMSASLLS